MDSGIDSQLPFKDLLEQCRDLTRAFPEYQFKLSAALAVVLGWLLTSSSAGDFIARHPDASRSGICVIMASIVAGHLGWVFRHVRRADACHAELKRAAHGLGIQAPALLESLRLDPFLPWSYVLLTVLICAANITIVFLHA